ncbi:non-canonical ubiquitin conjugating enzyme [Rhodotorula toruloides ATCC 204091]|uniref:BY PROTMAP: gi/342320574/gb/EGU12514.1/ non-canonical ubiquitin conjugating enzyme [Rhodotorula glutinis ATCC 204091] n=1 Tax=Rhodotorula toruloides TaxID=5286 RepID=A0A0K3CGX5_RHOTO|nr:non-canonical ubiquitin conjugating enzyme [Rhodotorula toruloides ATCC 204091]
MLPGLPERVTSVSPRRRTPDERPASTSHLAPLDMAAARAGLSTRSAGVRRLLQEARELENDDCPDFAAAPLEDDLFSWHFTIRGPGGDYEGGVYHGKMIVSRPGAAPARFSALPSEYPFKPPEIYMLTPSGRFEVNKKICLSISSFHPETWQPSWGVRTALLALMAFFDTEPKGAVGSLDAPPAERQRLAKASQTYRCSACGFDADDSTSFASLRATQEGQQECESGEGAAGRMEKQADVRAVEAEETMGTASDSALARSVGGSDEEDEAEGTAHGSPADSTSSTTIFPTSPASSVIRSPSGTRASYGRNHQPTSPALPPPAHRHPDPSASTPSLAGPLVPPASVGGIGGPPSWVDRAIVVVLLALVAVVVRKFA